MSFETTPRLVRVGGWLERVDFITPFVADLYARSGLSKSEAVACAFFAVAANVAAIYWIDFPSLFTGAGVAEVKAAAPFAVPALVVLGLLVLLWGSKDER